MKIRALVFYVGTIVSAWSAEPTKLPHDNLLLRHSGSGAVEAVRTKEEWLERRAEIVRAMESIMGPFAGANSPKREPLEIRVEEEIDRGTYVVRRISYLSEPGSRIPAYLCIPKAALAEGARGFPAVLCPHPTDALGAKTVVGLSTKPNRANASELAARGFVTIAPPYPHLGGFAPDLPGLGYVSGTMKAIWDNTRALDLLETLPYVQHGKYGVIGHSLGGHNAIYTAVFDPRIVAVVSSSGFDSFLDYYGGNPAVWAAGKGWCQERYMPRLAAYAGRLGEIPFDFYEVIGALAPRPLFVNAPLRDANFQWKSVDRVMEAAGKVYALYGATDRVTVEHPDSEHDFPPAQREMAYGMLERVLK